MLFAPGMYQIPEESLVRSPDSLVSLAYAVSILTRLFVHAVVFLITTEVIFYCPFVINSMVLS